ncbi:MAG: UbiD family decarboxylase domain-containing protein, partial [Candidatus Hecatellaceae archaeon]
MGDLRSFLSRLEADGELKRIRVEVSPRFEAAAVIRRLEAEAAILFERVKGSNLPVVAGVCAARQRLFKALGVKGSLEFYRRLLEALDNPLRCEVADDGPVLEVSEEPDLTRLPILTHYEGDGGPYITASLVAARSPDGKVENVSIHRLRVLDRRRLAVRLVPRHLHKLHAEAREANKPLEVAVAIGVHPALMVA